MRAKREEMANMRWQVVGTVEFDFDVEVEAEDEDEAEGQARALEYHQLVEGAGVPRIDVDAVTKVSEPKRKSG